MKNKNSGLPFKTRVIDEDEIFSIYNGGNQQYMGTAKVKDRDRIIEEYRQKGYEVDVDGSGDIVYFEY